MVNTMRAPEFWHSRKPGGLGTLLAPLGWIYAQTVRARFAMVQPWRAEVPVLCVGNLTAGGAGKTPVALNLGARLAGRGIDAHFLSRGYGGFVQGPLHVEVSQHDYSEVGDEALLMARCRPTWISRNRPAGVRAAKAAGAEVVVMDDGFQNPSLVKDVSLLVVDGGYGFGNGRVIPAGPLRETSAAGLARADALVVIGDDEYVFAETVGKDLPVLHAHVKPGPEAEWLSGKPVVAFAGIGRPQKFFDTLRSIGCRIESANVFSDHYPYMESEIEELFKKAQASGAVLVTTEKDAVRLPGGCGGGVEVLSITLEWEDEALLDEVLERLIPRITDNDS